MKLIQRKQIDRVRVQWPTVLLFGALVALTLLMAALVRLTIET